MFFRFRRHRLFKRVFRVGISLTLIIAGAIFLWLASFELPDIKSLETRKINESTKIFDRTGKILLYDVFQGIKRTAVPLTEISRHIRNATVAIEDREFYNHRGVRPMSFIRAVIANLGAGSYSQGGSTITQQVVKNSILTTEKTITRKIKEWVLAIKLEQKLSKDEILTLYLNESPYGGSIYGIEEASRTFLGKKANELTIAESAYLASLPNAPTYYSPYGNHKEDLEARKNLILKNMLEGGFITEAEYKKAKVEKVTWQPYERTGIRAPHFVMYVREQLETKYGKRALEEDGLNVVTSLDWGLQEKAETIVNKYALQNKITFNAENASFVAVDPKSGAILSMVGSRDYFDVDIDGNFNIALAKRQPGSAFKPFVYATAFKKGYTPETVVFDLPTEFSTACTPESIPINPATPQKTCYRPENYDGIYSGPITLRNALAQSKNVPAIKTLYLAGIRDSIRTAKDMGISTLKGPDQYGLTLVLGGGEVSLLDLTSAYGVFANGGLRFPPTAILKVTDKTGTVREEWKPKAYPVLDEKIARTISDILSDEEARSPAFGQHSLLYFPNKTVAVKTGTTNDYRDAWIVGYTNDIATAAWAGNNDNRPMDKKVAGFIVAPIWRTIMDEIIKSRAPTPLLIAPKNNDDTLKPILRGIWQGGVSYYTDSITGKKATDYTPKEFRKEHVIKEVHTILKWLDKSNPRGEAPLMPELDSQYFLWETPIRKWVLEQGIVEETTAVIPIAEDDVHGPAYTPSITITNPIETTSYNISNRITVEISTGGRFPLSRMDVYVNGVYVGGIKKPPFSISFVPSDIEMIRTQNELKVIGIDSVGNRTEAVKSFSVQQ